MKKNTHIISIIRHFLRGKHSPEGEQLFDRWWNAPGGDKRISEEEASAMSDRIFTRLQGSMRNDKRIGMTWWKVAAAVLLLAGIGGYGLYRATSSDKKDWLLVATKVGEKRKLTLPDGSTIMLNEKSQVRYSSNGREVEVIGEAFFDVARDAAHPFIVTSRHATIEVLGTRFDVLSRQSDVVVVMQDGKVSLKDDRRDDAFTLVKGDIGVLADNGRLTKEAAVTDHENYFSWMDKQGLSFEGATLSQVVTQLERIYDCRIILDDPSLSQRKITLQYPVSDAETMLRVIAGTMQLSIVHTKNVYHIAAQ